LTRPFEADVEVRAVGPDIHLMLTG
jgi:hypothetical protein